MWVKPLHDFAKELIINIRIVLPLPDRDTPSRFF